MAIELPIGPLGYDDYAAIDDGNRYEIIDGELYPMSSPSSSHQYTVGEIFIALSHHAKTVHDGRAIVAPFDVVLHAERPGVVLQPDVLYLEREHRHRLTAANMQGPPDLAVEVLSPSNRPGGMRRKLAAYARHGVQELWIVPFPLERVEVWRLQPDGSYALPRLFRPGERLVSDLLPGFELDVASLFEPDDEG